MVIQPPNVDSRNREALLRDLGSLVPFFTPEWRLGDSGPSRALVEAYFLFQRQVVSRLNRVPAKLFLAFLDALGLSLLPAVPARAPLAFALAQGATEEVLVPAGTRVAAGEIVFETETSFVASPAALAAVLSAVPAEDRILDHLETLGKSETAVLFAEGNPSANIQEHAFYLGDPELFSITGASTIPLTFKANRPDLLRSGSVEWHWWGKAAGRSGWSPFKVSGEGNAVNLSKGAGEIETSEVDGVKSRWLRCRVRGKLLPETPLSKLAVGTVAVALRNTGLDPDGAFANDIPLPLPPSGDSPLLPFGTRPRQGDVFYLASQEAFSKRRAKITLDLTAHPGSVSGVALERVYGIGKNFRDRLAAAGVKTTADLLKLPVEQVAEIIRNRERNIPAERYLTRARNLQEAAAKQYYDKVVSAGGEAGGGAFSAPRLSWEFWNGKGWQILKDVRATTGATDLLGPAMIEFTCPEEMAATSVGGQENYWIRIRIASGDYGQEKFTFDGTTWKPDSSDVHPPQISSLTLSYTGAEKRVAAVKTFNNRQHETPGQERFSPFVPLDAGPKSLYLGFDRPLVNGPTSLLAVLEEQEYPEADRPLVAWECSSSEAAAWARLTAEDGTAGLTRTGTVSFLGPADAAPVRRFGQTLFWVRATDVEDRFDSGKSPASRLPIFAPAAAVKQPGKLTPCPDAASVFQALYPAPAAPGAPPPRLAGLFPNAVWASQTDTVQGERLGSSDGTANQLFRLSQSPVVAATVWVNELGALTAEEEALLKSDPGQIQEETDSAGNRVALWVRWTPVADLAVCARDSRVYAVEAVSGTVRFGDGVAGRIPPVGQENLKVDYKVGGGSAGNVGAGKIKTLKASLSRMDKVANPLPADGGSDAESSESVLERGPRVLKHRNRATTKEDYEWLAMEASRSVARVRCLPNFDDQGRSRPGWVTVLIVPAGLEAQPLPSPRLKEQVRAYLSERAPSVVSARGRLVVAGPVYLTVSVEADLYPVSLGAAATVEQATRLRLEAFLHPLTGGLEGKGWDFGQAPCLSDLLALLQGIEGMDYLGRVTATVEEPKSGRRGLLATDGLTVLLTSPYTMISSGQHTLHVRTAFRVQEED